MSEIRVNNLSNESSTGGPTISGITTFSGTNFFVPPVGSTLQRPENPQKGAIRFNTDTKHLEYFKGDVIGWTEVEASHDQLDGGYRGIAMGGETPSSPNASATIDYFTISTLGNGQDFGDLTQARGTAGACASRTRGLCMSGYEGGYHNVIDYITISSTGNALDFGDLPVAVQGVDALSNATRGVMTSGSNASPGITNVLSYVTIATTGNTQDFGDQQRSSSYSGTCSSSTRGILAGGYGPAAPTISKTIEYLTIATTGNTSDFGDFNGVRIGAMGVSNSTRGVFGGGLSPSYLNNIEYITIATTGNAADFGDLINSRHTRSSGMASPTRGLFQGGSTSPGTNRVDNVDYIEFATTGNSLDFGNLTQGMSAIPGCSNGHGGL